MSLISYAKRVCPHSLKSGIFPNLTSKRPFCSSTNRSLQRAATTIRDNGRNYLETKQVTWKERYNRWTFQQLKFDEDRFLPFIATSEEDTNQELVSTEEDIPDTKSAKALRVYNVASTCYYITKFAFIFFL